MCICASQESNPGLKLEVISFHVTITPLALDFKKEKISKILRGDVLNRNPKPALHNAFNCLKY
jgi:hypothetical protein